MADTAEPKSLDLPSLFYGAEPVPSLTEGVNMFVTPLLPDVFEDVTPPGEVTDATQIGSTVFVSRDFYDALVARVEAAQAAREDRDTRLPSLPQAVEAAAKKDCPICHGEGWVCENHTDRPWGGSSIADNACECGAGCPCRCTGLEP